MTDAALRLLQLQEEFHNRHQAAGVAAEFREPSWAPRTEEQIAEDYAAALREALA